MIFVRLRSQGYFHNFREVEAQRVFAADEVWLLGEKLEQVLVYGLGCVRVELYDQAAGAKVDRCRGFSKGKLQ